MASSRSTYGTRRLAIVLVALLIAALFLLPSQSEGLLQYVGGPLGQIDESIYVSPADTGSNFRIDSCQYIYNLSASALGVGTYRVDIKINGQVVGSAVFGLK